MPSPSQPSQKYGWFTPVAKPFLFKSKEGEGAGVKEAQVCDGATCRGPATVGTPSRRCHKALSHQLPMSYAMGRALPPLSAETGAAQGRGATQGLETPEKGGNLRRKAARRYSVVKERGAPRTLAVTLRLTYTHINLIIVNLGGFR